MLIGLSVVTMDITLSRITGLEMDFGGLGEGGAPGIHHNCGELSGVGDEVMAPIGKPALARVSGPNETTPGFRIPGPGRSQEILVLLTQGHPSRHEA